MKRSVWIRLGEGLTAVATRISRVQTWLLLTLCYGFVVAPIALIMKWCADPLRLRPSFHAIWRAKPQSRARWVWARAQF